MQGVLELPDDLAPLGDAIARFLLAVTQRFDAQLHSTRHPVADLVEHVEGFRGKMLRPTLVAACGMASGHPSGARADSASAPDSLLTPNHIIAGAVCEMVHMATLVHDDVLDEADVRRHSPTINRLRGNESAVILGDYLFSAAYHLCSRMDSESLARLAALEIGRASMAMCSGELMQLHHRGNLALTEAEYFDIVSGKTGELIAASCVLGAMISGSNGEELQAFRTYGLKLGVAFQIQDDLLDLMGAESIVGKSVGKDVEKGKMTLPMIHHLAHARDAIRHRSVELLSSPEGLGDRKAELLAAMDDTHSIDAARKAAAGLVEQAKSALLERPDSPARRLLRAMADAVIFRAC